MHEKTFGVVFVSDVIKWYLEILIVVDVVTEIKQNKTSSPTTGDNAKKTIFGMSRHNKTNTLF